MEEVGGEHKRQIYLFFSEIDIGLWKSFPSPFPFALSKPMSTQMTHEIFLLFLSVAGVVLVQFVTSSPTTPYDNCVTNQSFNEQNCWQSIQRQRRENLIKLDLESNYMTRHERPMQVGDNSAGCSVESSPVDSLLDDQGECCIHNCLSDVCLHDWDRKLISQSHPLSL